MSYTDPTTGLTFGFPDGADNWGPATNRSLQRLAYLLSQLVLLQVDLNDPPSSPSEGDRYAVGPNPTGLWASFSRGDVAVWGQNATNSGLGWQRLRPYVGLRGYDRGNSQSIIWDGTIWKSEVGGQIRGAFNFDPSTMAGDGSPTNPWRPIFPADNDTQSNWQVTDTTSPAYIQNVPSLLKNLRSSDILPSLTGETTFNYTGNTRSGTHTELLVSFNPNNEQVKLSKMGFTLGARLAVEINRVFSSTRFRLRVNQGGYNFTTPYNAIPSFRFISRKGSTLRNSSRIYVYLEVRYTSGNDNFDANGTVTYGLLLED